MRALWLGLLVACAPKIERGQTAAARDSTTPAWVQLDEQGPNVYLQAVVRAGSSYDPVGHEGLAALTAAAMVDAGAGDRTAQELREALYATANSISVVVDRDFVSFRLRCHQDHAVLCAQAFADVLTAPRFRPADVELLKTDAIDAVTAGQTDDDERLGENAFYATLYSAHPYGHPIQGRAGVLPLLQPDDLRRFHTQHYVRTAVTLGISGRHDAEVDGILTAALATLPTTTAPERILPAPIQPKGRQLVVLDTATSVTGFHLGHTIDVDRNHPDWAALRVGLAVLGAHRQSSGRLFRTLRTDRGLNYGTYAYSEPFVQQGWGKLPENGVLHAQNHFSLWIRPTSIENGPFALKLAIDELEQLVEKGITAEEFEGMRRNLALFQPLEAVSPSRRLGFRLDAVTTGTPDLLDFMPRALEALTLDDVNAALKRHLHPDSLFIVAVSGEGESLAALLGEDKATSIVYADVVPEPAQAERDAVIADKALALESVFVQPAEGIFR